MDLDWIVKGLEKPGKTRAGIAEAIGRHPSTITSLLTRKRELKAREIALIAKYLEIDIDKWLQGEELIEGASGRLKAARERAGYERATHAAEAMGIPYGTYSGHENGARGIRRQDIQRYAAFFRVTPGWLQFGSGDIGDQRTELGDRIRTVRGELSLAEFGKLIGVSGQAVSQWENGATSPSLTNLGRISEKLGIEMSTILGYEASSGLAVSAEMFAALEGALEGFGLSDEQRAGFFRAISEALAEQIDFTNGKDRLMARRTIARVLARNL